MAVGVWSPELSDPWRLSGLTRATHQAPQPPGAAALTGVRVRGLWRDGEGWGGGRNLTAAGGWAAGGGTVQLLEGFLVAVEVRLGGEQGEGLAPSIQRAQTSGIPPPRRNAFTSSLLTKKQHSSPIMLRMPQVPEPPPSLPPPWSLSPPASPAAAPLAHLLGPPSGVGRDGADHLGREDGGAAGRAGLRRALLIVAVAGGSPSGRDGALLGGLLPGLHPCGQAQGGEGGAQRDGDRWEMLQG